jgi:hypothetical protein
MDVHPITGVIRLMCCQLSVHIVSRPGQEAVEQFFKARESCASTAGGQHCDHTYFHALTYWPAARTQMQFHRPWNYFGTLPLNNSRDVPIRMAESKEAFMLTPLWITSHRAWVPPVIRDAGWQIRILLESQKQDKHN